MMVSAVLSQEKFSVSQAGHGTRTYLPGDLVHFVVGAPSNVVEVIAATPDGQRIALDFERRTHTWHGLWEVPYGFKKGSYSANLIAVDVEGKSFEGATNTFFIGEPALITLIGLGTREGVARRKTKVPAVIEEEIIEEEEAPPARPAPAPKKKIVRPAKVAKAKPPAEDPNILKARLITAARSFIAQQEYSKARAELKSLLKIEPDNSEIRSMMNRLDSVVKAREAKP